jgi:phosphatidylinositol glycan class V
MYKLRKKICVFAVYTRLFVIILQFVCNLVIPDHDNGAFQWNLDPKWEPTVTDKIVGFFFDGLVRWDSHHFLHIATHGYTFETNIAFFPLFPLVVRCLATFLFWLQEDYMFISFVSCVKISATVINMASFVLAAQVMYELSRKVLKDEYIAYKAGLLFTVNPASIFFTSGYSEALNALFTFIALDRMTKGFSAKTSLALALATATRANSILNAGFVVYNSLKIVATESVLYVRLKKLAKPGVKVEISSIIANILGDALIPGILNLISCVGPFILFQWFCFTNFCRVTKKTPVLVSEVPGFVLDYGRANLLKVVGDAPSPWCEYEVPISYGYIQSNYWGNGFLQYWEFRQVPNFLLAAPTIGLVLWHSYHFFLVHSTFCTRLGLIDNNLLGLPRQPVALELGAEAADLGE